MKTKFVKKLSPHAVYVRLRHPRFGMEIGFLEAMTATRVFVSGISLSDYQTEMIVEVDLLGQEWDSDAPSFSYEVTYVGSQGIRLKLNNDVFNGAYVQQDTEYPEHDSYYAA
ncbi:MAG: hypothetical protein ACPGMR_10630 [Pontibacterium sp.]